MEQGITTYSVEAQRLYERGLAAARGGQRRIAAGLLTKAVQLDPRHEQAWLWLSGVLDEQRDVEFCLQSALKINPDNQQARKGLAWIQQQQQTKAASITTPKPPSALQQISIPTVEDRAAEAAPMAEKAWWQEWRDSERSGKVVRVASLIALILAISFTGVMLAVAKAQPLPEVPPILELANPDQPDAQAVVAASEINQAELLRYLSQVGEIRQRLDQAVTIYRETSDRSTVATNQIEAAKRYRDVVRQAYTDLERIKAPDILAEIHDEYKQGLQLEQAAFDDILEYYTNYNVAIANRAALRLQEADGHLQRAIGGLDAYNQELSNQQRGDSFGER
ncbi:hypothetical protein [Herpetosiphon llansteffanensis]|uniref:hypothetical protein n=1 Tax=Herpetosiphon llansteffanensis TaxID=2094568 RepID=UPI000D7BFAF3|nr:hypothetical protein [Herpetosiphon llansteffanensis]